MGPVSALNRYRYKFHLKSDKLNCVIQIDFAKGISSKLCLLPFLLVYVHFHSPLKSHLTVCSYVNNKQQHRRQS